MRSVKHYFLFFMSAMTLWCGVAFDANAQMVRLRRQDCFNPQRAGFRGMQIGIRNASMIFDRMWRRVNFVCDDLERVAQIIADTQIRPPATGGEFAACFYVGYTDTLWSKLEQAYLGCSDACFSAGSAIGEISANAYCAASMSLGGLYDPGFIAQPSLRICGTEVVFGCKTAYLQTAISRTPGCFPYTSGAFTLTFENMIRQDCWVPEDVPIRGNPYSPYSSLNNKADNQFAAWMI